LTALALYRARFPGKTLLQGLLIAIMPSLVIGIALLLFFVAINLPLGVLTIIWRMSPFLFRYHTPDDLAVCSALTGR